MTNTNRTATLPTVDQLAIAFAYIMREFKLEDGIVTGEMWAEGLAFGRFAACWEDRYQAEQALTQLPAAKWMEIVHRANYLRATS